MANLTATEAVLLAALKSCVVQIQQMQGMFDDSDGAIQAALEDAQDAIDMAIAKATGDTA
ncbi:hypothetical protein [Burkholderia multivorans]|uniref:hypothetical protein n=1 Tax=Burkholderia multivorans TaxID=87883 RepID=UPI001C236191|nr:hypothetical protein [Burkholderia multivorans]MBU9211670.1 hypothetical protein [Burkholderia multivorans]